MKRVVTIAAAAVAVIAVLVFVVRHRAAPASAPSRSRVSVATVRLGSVEETLDLTGRIGPAAGAQTKLAFAIAGTVDRVAVSLGERVAGGTVLAQLDATPLALSARQAQADARAASAQEAYAQIDRVSVRLRVDEAELARQRALLRAGVVAQRDVEAADATVAADRAAVQSAHDAVVAAQAQAAAASARASSATYDLSRADLRAPFDGVVVAIYVQPGQVVDTTMPIVAIAASTTSLATLDIPATDVPRISSGDLVHVTASGWRFDARIGAVAPAVNPATGLAEVSVVGIPSDVPPGTPIDATVVYGRVRGLVVPQSSLIADPQSGRMLAFVESIGKDGTQTFAVRHVGLGASDSRFAVVRGLRVGERVAAQGTILLLAPTGGGD